MGSKEHLGRQIPARVWREKEGMFCKVKPSQGILVSPHSPPHPLGVTGRWMTDMQMNRYSDTNNDLAIFSSPNLPNLSYGTEVPRV